LAAEVNVQLAVGAPAATSFEPITLADLRQRWLDHHEHVLRSAVSTINRYRTASQHLLNFAETAKLAKRVCQFKEAQAEAFVRYLRGLKVAPNGHPNSDLRSLRDKGIRFILEVCRTLFNFAIKRRHLPPYGENPFVQIQVERIPIEDAKPIELLTAAQEAQFLQACDDWQLPIFATLLLTGMRPGEAVHLLVEDIDFDAAVIHVRNKPVLGWRIKTRQQRSIPMVAELADVLRNAVGVRQHGPAFLRRRFANTAPPPMCELSPEQLASQAAERTASIGNRDDRGCVLRRFWTEMGRVKESRLRVEFMRITRRLGLPQLTATKTLRHQFATALQEANVDPLIRNQLMGHVPADDTRGKGPLGMTAVYSHASPATIHRQLIEALGGRPAVEFLRCHRRTRPAEKKEVA
jgi:integrase